MRAFKIEDLPKGYSIKKEGSYHASALYDPNGERLCSTVTSNANEIDSLVGCAAINFMSKNKEAILKEVVKIWPNFDMNKERSNRYEIYITFVLPVMENIN